MKVRVEPFFWSLFGGGGVLSSMLLPVLLIAFFILMPLELLGLPAFDWIQNIVSHWISRLVLFATVSLSMFHWAHRFRFTLYEGLQLHHYNVPIAIFCYGSAFLVTGFAAYFFWTM